MMCDFIATNETHPTKGLIFHCVNCSAKCYRKPVDAHCREPAPPLDCIHRGPIIAIITKCGCGAIAPAPVSTCSLFRFCVPHALNIKAKWRDVVESKPAACATCRERQDA